MQTYMQAHKCTCTRPRPTLLPTYHRTQRETVITAPCQPRPTPSPASQFCLRGLSFLFVLSRPGSLLCPLGDTQRLQSATKGDSKDRTQWTPGSSHTSAYTSACGGEGEGVTLFIYLQALPCSTPPKLLFPAGKNEKQPQTTADKADHMAPAV